MFEWDKKSNNYWEYKHGTYTCKRVVRYEGKAIAYEIWYQDELIYNTGSEYTMLRQWAVYRRTKRAGYYPRF